MRSIQALREQRLESVKAIRKLMEDTEDSEWTPENQNTYDELSAQIENFDAEIDRLQKVIDIEAANTETIDTSADRLNISKDEAQALRAADNAMFNAWARGTPLDEEQQAMLAERTRRFQDALSIGTNTEGGYTSSVEFGGELFRAMSAFGGVRQVATVRPTEMGNTIEWPTESNTGQEGILVAENATMGTALDPVFGTVNIGAFKYSSRPVAVSWELLQDTMVDLEGYLRDALSERLARITNRHYTVGTGSGQPNGIVTAAALGVTAAAATAITFDELIDLEHSVDPAYRASGECRWMFHDQTLKALKQLKDGDSRPIWLPGYQTGEGNQILDYEYTINQNMDQLATANDVVLFGRMTKYMVRDVAAVQLFRMTDSAYTQNGQVGFLAFMRTDGQFVGADNGCIARLRTA